MKLNVAQCRSAKKTAGLRGLRRSVRIASSSPSCHEQIQLVTLTQQGVVDAQYHGQDLLISGHLTRQKSFTHEKAPLVNEKFFDQERKVLSSERSFTSGNFNNAVLSRQTSLKIEALIEPRALSRTNSCTTIGRKRVVGVDDFSEALELANLDGSLSLSSLTGHEFSPRKKFASPRTPSTCLDRSPSASLTVSEFESLSQKNSSLVFSPCTPTSKLKFGLAASHRWFPAGDSLLEDLPFDLLLRIVCCLEHDDLRTVSLVCSRLSRAVSVAQDYHFCYRTPHRVKEGKSAQIYLFSGEQSAHQGGLADTFIRPPTPNAPKHCSTRPAELRFFPEYPFGSSLSQPEQPMPENPIKSFKIGSQRVLFDEEELCKAVAQNSL